MCASASRSLAGSDVMSAVRSVGANRADFDCNSETALSTAGAGVGGGVDGACALHAANVAIKDADPTAMITRFMNFACWPVRPFACSPVGLLACLTTDC